MEGGVGPPEEGAPGPAWEVREGFLEGVDEEAEVEGVCWL